jgi:hypothetical protein
VPGDSVNRGNTYSMGKWRIQLDGTRLLILLNYGSFSESEKLMDFGHFLWALARDMLNITRTA